MAYSQAGFAKKDTLRITKTLKQLTKLMIRK
jgi:hypothetical protein